MAKKSLKIKCARLKESAKNKTVKYKSRVYNRCNLCGRPRAYFRKFGLCRLCFRKLAHLGEIPGVKKASW